MHVERPLTEQLLELATARAEQLGKSIDELYAEALAKHVARSLPVDSALNQGHGLPSRAFRPMGPA